MSGLTWKVLAGLLVAMVALQAPIYLAMSGASNGASGHQGAMEASSSQAAREYVSRVSMFINVTLRVASEYNITIPDNLTGNVTEARNLVNQAFQALEANVTEAVMLATRASSVFAPVAVYVYNSMPASAKQDMEKRMLERAVVVREKLVVKLEEMLRHVNDTGVPVGDEWSRVKQLENMIIEAKQALREDNVTKARHMVEMFDHEARQEAPVICKDAYKGIAVNAALATALDKAVVHAEMLASTINVTVQVINETGNVTPGLVERIGVLQEHAVESSIILSKIINYVVNNAGNETINQTLLQALEQLRDAFNESAVYLGQAKSIAEENNTTATLDLLWQAYNVMNSTLANVTSLVPMPHVVQEKLVHEMRHANEVMKHAREKAMEQHWVEMSREIDHKMQKLQQAYQKYENGQLSKSKFKVMLEKAKMELERMKQRVQGQAPDWLIEKIDNAIQWINQHMP